MKDQLKIKASLTSWDKVLILQDSTITKAILFLLTILLLSQGKKAVKGDIYYWFFEFSDKVKTTAYINHVSETQYEDEDGVRYQYFYSYVVDGETFFGDSYSSLSYCDVGDECDIEYIIGHPQMSHLVKGSLAPYDGKIQPLVFVLILGLLWSLVGQYRVLKGIQKVLRNACVRRAERIEIQSETYINEDEDVIDVIYELKYVYQIQGKTLYTSLETSDVSEFAVEEDVLISEEDHELVVLVKCLPDTTAVLVRKLIKKYRDAKVIS